jgi:hypothetical protein
VAKRDYPYPEDEFDSLGADRVPQGVHRAPPSRWRTLLPFILVLILAPALAYLGVSYLSNQGSPASSSTTTPTAPESVAPEETATPEETAAPEETESPEPEPTPEANVIRDAQIFVLNGAGVAGLAGGAADKLTADGFTNVTPDDYGSRLPTVSTVYYNNADLADTAQQVGAVLGIAQLVELADATDSIAVVLRRDYEP